MQALKKSKKTVLLIKVLFTSALIAWVLNSAGLTSEEGLKEFYQVLSGANNLFLFISFLFIPIMDLVSTIKWYCITQAKKISISYWRLLAFYIIGRFFNLILPSSIGGDLIRVHFLAKHSGRLADAAAIVFFERLTGLITLILCTLLALFFAIKSFPSIWLKLALLTACCGLIVLIALIFNDKPLTWIKKIVCSKLPVFSSAFEKLEKMRTSLEEMGKNKSVMIVAFINSLIFQIDVIFNTWIGLLAFNVDVSFSTIAISTPLIVFIMNIPVSIGNIGIMEFAYTFVLTRFGLSAPEALSAALLLRVKSIVAAGLGGFTYSIMSSSVGSKEELESKLNQ